MEFLRVNCTLKKKEEYAFKKAILKLTKFVTCGRTSHFGEQVSNSLKKKKKLVLVCCKNGVK